jgi:hypothetical protein
MQNIINILEKKCSKRGFQKQGKITIIDSAPPTSFPYILSPFISSLSNLLLPLLSRKGLKT